MAFKALPNLQPSVSPHPWLLPGCWSYTPNSEENQDSVGTSYGTCPQDLFPGAVSGLTVLTDAAYLLDTHCVNCDSSFHRIWG